MPLLDLLTESSALRLCQSPDIDRFRRIENLSEAQSIPLDLSQFDTAFAEVTLGSQAAPVLGAAGDALQAGAAYQQLDSVEADADPAAQSELGVDPPAAVGLPGVGVHLADDIGQPGMPDRRAEGGRLGQA